MRTRKIFKKISVTEEIYIRLKETRREFQKTIGGGKWSLSDTLTEMFKILDQVEGIQWSKQENKEDENNERT